jgi:hypothetical protein
MVTTEITQKEIAQRLEVKNGMPHLSMVYVFHDVQHHAIRKMGCLSWVKELWRAEAKSEWK